MIKTINIERQAFGSRTDSIGDTTLFYSANSSTHAKDVKGQFMDTPPRLSLNHASLVWRYNADVDKYLLIHVQGSHVVNQAKGRQYTFRAGYEVSRDDMNAIGFQLTSLFQAMPKMGNMQSGRVEATAEVDTDINKSASPSEALASHLLKAVMDGQQLFISIESSGDSLKNDGIFDSQELRTLLATIDNMAVDKRRYVLFGFCVDDYYVSVLEDVPVVVYLKDSQLTIPQEACCLSWEEVTTTFAGQPVLGIEQEWKGADAPLLTPEQIAVMRKTVNGTDQLIGGEWSIWTGLGHQLSELKVHSWSEFIQLHERMDEETRVQLFAAFKDSSLSWTLDGLTEDLFNRMDYREEQKLELQKKSLMDYLLNSDAFKYGFLYPKGLTKTLTGWITDHQFLSTLPIGTQEDSVRWYDIYQQRHVLTDSVKEFLTGLFCKHTACTLEEVMKTFVLVLEKKSHYLQEQFLRKIYKETLSQLLKSQTQPSGLIKYSEQLLEMADGLPKNWKTYVNDTLHPAIMEALRSDGDNFFGPLSGNRINDLIEAESYYWKLEDSHPHVSDKVQEELTVIRHQCYEKTVNKDKKFRNKGSQTNYTKYLCFLVAWLIGLLLGVLITYWLLIGNKTINF